jgi:hypothetical protein
MINQEYVYHASKGRGLKVLEPKVSNHKVPWVYATKDIVLAASFLGDNHSFICERFYTDGGFCLWERFDGAFDLGYKEKRGSIYCLKPDTFKEGMTSFPLEVVSELPVAVEEEIFVDNVQEYLLNLERKGELKIFRFPEIPVGKPENKEDIVEIAKDWTVEFGEHVLEQIKEYHPDVLDRVTGGLQEQGYEFKSEEWI